MEPKTTPLELEDAEVRARMQILGAHINSQLPVGWFFVLLAGSHGKGRRLNYVANAERGDVVRLMYEFIERTKEQFGEHVDETKAAAEDEQLARAQQRIAELEGDMGAIRDTFFQLIDRLTDPKLTDSEIAAAVKEVFGDPRIKQVRDGQTRTRSSD